MRLFVLVLLSGCHLTVYAGPRLNSTGDVIFEFGASTGAAVKATSRGAVTASADVTIQFDQAASKPEVIARSTRPPSIPQYSRGTMRGVLAWSNRSLAHSDYAVRSTGLGWSLGVYGGADTRHDDVNVPLVGVIASVLPFDGGAIKDGMSFALGIGVQVAAESLADGNSAVRGALTYDMQFLKD